ncbi:hypothetical protein V6Z11_A05G211100 [Gossypium hirsutum]
MAIRVTFTYSGYVAQNLASTAGFCLGSCSSRSAHEFGSTSSGMYSTLPTEILNDGCKNLIIMGLISLIKSTAYGSYSSGSKWLPCYEPNPGKLDSSEADGGGTTSNNDRNLSLEVLNVCSEDAKAAFTTLTVNLLFRSFMAKTMSILLASMYPNLGVGNRILAEKVSYFFREPEVSNIVIFRAPPILQVGIWIQYNGVFFKRIVAKAGDCVEACDGKLFINGVAQDEDFVLEPLAYKMDQMISVVPEGYVFVLGDNRNNSFDSHYWGPLPIENIVGRSVFCYWPPSKVSATIYDLNVGKNAVAVS